MFSTGQVARTYKVSLQTLRHYESLGLLTPVRLNGQRVYHAKDMDRLSTILDRKRAGFALAQIKAMLPDTSTKASVQS